MRNSINCRSSYFAIAVLFCFLVSVSSAFSADDKVWIGTWCAVPDQAGPPLKVQTIRQIVRVSIGGTHTRIRLSNLYGNQSLHIGEVHLALHGSGSAIIAGTDRTLTFDGKTDVNIPVGRSVLSDPVKIVLSPLQELAISMFFPFGTGASTQHGTAMQTAYLVSGNATADLVMQHAETDDSRYFMTDVEVVNSNNNMGVFVVLGDSITDGVGSSDDKNMRWPDVLAERLQGTPGLPSIAVLNAGISGNRLLNDAVDPFVGPSMLSRLERDVLSKSGVRWLMLFAGINDITARHVLTSSKDQVTVAQLIDGMKVLIDRAHAKGVKVWGSTLLPNGGTVGIIAPTASGEKMRQEINAWIRTSRAFDAVFDAERVLSSPDHPDQLRIEYDSGDHTHPNDAGYRALANAIDLKLFVGGE